MLAPTCFGSSIQNKVVVQILCVVLFISTTLKYNSLGIEIQRNVEPEMYGYTGYNWSHWNGNVTLKENLGSYTG
jgi:hypothetical protein